MACLIAAGCLSPRSPANAQPKATATGGVQKSLDFPGNVYGVARDTSAIHRVTRQAAWFAAHLVDRPIE